MAFRQLLSRISLREPLVLSAAVCYGLNTVGFTATWLTGTHKLTDLTGTGAFIASSVATCLVCVREHKRISPGKPLPLRPMLLTCAVAFWGTRLASFLFHRIMTSPEDARLSKFFPQPGELPIRLAGFWSIQATWSFVCLLPVTMSCKFPAATAKLTPLTHLALACFAAGFMIETRADIEKSRFKAIPGNKELWCDVGLWKYSRHPNYFGEMVVWWSIFVAAYSGKMVPRWTAFSPLLVSVLLVFVSGIPIIEQKYDAKYATNKKYQEYKASTSILVPLPPIKAVHNR